MIKLSKKIETMGFSLQNVENSDFDEFYRVRKETSKTYVDKFFGGWEDKFQREFNFDIFSQSLTQDYFQKVLLNGKIVGFCGFSIFKDCIGCMTLQVTNIEGRKEFMTWFLKEVVKLSKKLKLPINMKVFLDNSDIEIYKQVGFAIQSTTKSHYIIRKIN